MIPSLIHSLVQHVRVLGHVSKFPLVSLYGHKMAPTASKSMFSYGRKVEQVGGGHGLLHMPLFYHVEKYFSDYSLQSSL